MEQWNEILECGIDVFAVDGYMNAKISQIAKKANVSVGVIYKYYGDKERFFLACVRHSLELLQVVLNHAIEESEDVMECMHHVIRSLMKHARENASYNVMYHEITGKSCKQYAVQLAGQIESLSASVYGQILENAKTKGFLRKDVDPHVAAFFFDNLLMLLQFSYSCEYYQERMRIYCGENVMNQQDFIEEQLIGFLKGALLSERP